MRSASTVRFQVESALARKIPAALTPPPKSVRPAAATGIMHLDELLQGGFPIGAMTELIGSECSGRTSVALSFLARLTAANKVCAWIDVSNAFDPASAAASGVDLRKLLWIRCGAHETATTHTMRHFFLQEKCFDLHPAKQGPHGRGFGSHPRNEVRGLSNAVEDLFALQGAAPQHAPQPFQQHEAPSSPPVAQPVGKVRRARQYDAIEQGIRSADLLLQTGGFSALVLDLGSIAPEYVARVELSTWHRYRLAAERTQASFLLLAQHPCAKSSSELQLRFSSVQDKEHTTVLNRMRPRVEIVRQRSRQTESTVVPLRKPPQSSREVCWENPTTWAVQR